ncbi:solute carrier family 26 member 6-like [Arapaima gigas]
MVVEQRSAEYQVRRCVLDEQSLEELAQRQIPPDHTPLKSCLRNTLRCSVPRLRRCLVTCFPVMSWLPGYPIRDYVPRDLISGVSVGIMHLPQGMAYALLASVPPVFGLYTSFYPVLVYFIFGTSRHISIGTFAVISIMVGSVTERLAPDSLFPGNSTNMTGEIDVIAQEAFRVQVAATTTVLGGILQVLLGLVRFGFVATYLSEPLVRGYTTAAAVHVVVSQLKYIFGVSPRRFAGPLSLVYTLVDICSLLPKTNVPILVVGVVSLVALAAVKELNSAYSRKLLLPIPIELIVIVVATLISFYADLAGRFDVNVVGQIPSGLMPPSAPNASMFLQVTGDAFAIAVVSYAINISLGKTFAVKHGYKVDSNQELLALGLSNVVGGLFHCYSVTSSMSRSLVQESTGGQTQVAGAISALIVLVTVLKLGPLFEKLPKAVLATIVLVNLKGMFKQCEDVPVLWRSNRTDLLVWTVTLISTLLLNLDLGLAASLAFALLTAAEVPGVTIFRSSTTVYFANAELYLEALLKKSRIDVGKMLALKKKEAAELERQKKDKEKKAKKARRWVRPTSSTSPPSLDVHEYSLQECGSSVSAEEKVVSGYVNHGGPDAPELEGGTTSPSVLNSGDAASEDQTPGSLGLSTHSVILDLSTASFIDTDAIKTLKNIFRDLAAIDMDVYLAGCQSCVVEQLERGNFFSSSLSKRCLFATVHDAVLHCLHQHQRTSDNTYSTEL